MSRHRPTTTIAPLLSFPPNPITTRSNSDVATSTVFSPAAFDPPTTSSTFSTTSSSVVPSQPFKRHLITRICLMTPLFFTSLIYLFAAYAYLFSLVVDYLWIEKDSHIKAIIYGSIFLWFELNAFLAVWQCWYRGGGNISSSASSTSSTAAAALASNAQLDEEQSIDSSGRIHRIPNEGEGLLGGDAGLTINNGESSSRNEGKPHTSALRELNDLVGHYDSERTREGSGSRGVQVKSDGTQRWCRKCRIPKPDRAHHCSSCKTCVLKMDHHCPWLGGGCVGYTNYKFFLIFLLYSGILGIWVAITTMKELIDFVSLDEDNYELAPVLWAILFFIGLIFGISIGLFGTYHFYLLLINRTTIESMEGSTSIVPSDDRPLRYRTEDHALTREERKGLEKAQAKLNVYDLGWRENFKQVFGEDWRWWFVPFGHPPGDGRSFPVNKARLEQLRAITTKIRSGQRVEDHHSDDDDDTS